MKRKIYFLRIFDELEQVLHVLLLYLLLFFHQKIHETQELYTSFTSYEQQIRILNFCNEFLFIHFVRKYWQDERFKLRPKYIKK